MNEIRVQGLLAQRYNTHYLGLVQRITRPALATPCCYSNNLSSHPSGDTMHQHLKIKIQNALKSAIGIDPEALGVFVGGRRRNRRKKKKNGQNKRKQKKAEKQSKDKAAKEQEKKPLIGRDYNDNVSCSIASQIIYGLPQTTIATEDNNNNEKEIPPEVVISQPKTTWEERVEEERKENTINNAYLLKDIDIDKLLSDDLIISSKMTRAEIMATMEELKGGFELISLDGEDSDYDDDEDEQVCDIGEDKNITTLRQELEDAVNANSIKEGTDTDEPEVEMTEERFDNEVVIHETDETVECQPQMQDEVIVKPETVPLIERACPVYGQNPDVACCVIL
ncbi:hypothetical protein ScPMuIL_009473 [Solemya velum]